MLVSYSAAMILDTLNSKHTQKDPLLAYGLIFDVLRILIKECFINISECFIANVVEVTFWVYDLAWFFIYLYFAGKESDNVEACMPYVACCILLFLAMLVRFSTYNLKKDYTAVEAREQQHHNSITTAASQQLFEIQQVFGFQVLPRVETEPTRQTPEEADLPPSYEDVLNNDFGSTNL